MTLFHDVRFPLNVAAGSTGGLERRTAITESASGYEARNAQWSSSRRRYNAGYGVRTIDDLHKVLNFFEARNGRLYAFCFRDFFDWKSSPSTDPISATDETLGIGDGRTKQFPLFKTYRSDDMVWKRPIKKPDISTMKLLLADRTQRYRRHWRLLDGGIIDFYSPPAVGAVVQAGFEFDVPVRFDTDYLAIDTISFQAGEVPEIPLVEVKL